MVTLQSTSTVTYGVSDGVSLFHTYIVNITTNDSVTGFTNGAVNSSSNLTTDVDFQGLEVSTGGGPGSKNKSSLGPPFGLTVHSEEHLIGTSVVLGIMILFCIIGNCFVIAAVVLERSLHNVANYLILSLAVADLMVAVLVMPLSVVAEISRVWFLHSEVCDMWISFDVLCCTASILHLVAIALDRYWAVTSIDYMRRRSAKRILLMILVVWIVALTISIPPLFGWRDPSNDPDVTGQCMISQDHGYTVFSTVGAFYLPMFIMICIYSRIFMVARKRIRKEKFNKKKRNGKHRADGQTVAAEHIALTVTVASQPEYSVVSNCNGCSPEKNLSPLNHCNSKNGLSKNTDTDSRSNLSVMDSPIGRRSNDQTLGYTNGIEADPPTTILDRPPGGGGDVRRPCLPSSRQKEKLEQKRERKAARTLAIITGAFLLCWLPFFIVALTAPFIRGEVPIPPIVESLLLWLGYLNSLLNPIIYTIFSPEFRNAFRKILFGKYSRRRR
ncbi:5-hydroxytryptamine receptor [Nucella lapillus]